MSQQQSPLSELPPYYPGSQRMLSLDESNVIESAQSSEHPLSSASSACSEYILPAPLPPYYPMPLMNNLLIAPANLGVPNQTNKNTLPLHFPPSFQNALLSTPVKQRVGTARLPHEQSKITVDKLAQLLQKELEQSRVYGPDFIPLIYPDQSLPIPINDNFLKTLAEAGIWHPRNGKLVRPKSHSEDDIANWLNLITDTIAESFAESFPDLKVKRRLWYAGNKMVPPKGSAIVRKPDIVLLTADDAKRIIASKGTSYEEKTQWAMILALGETTAEAQNPRRMLDTVDGKSYILFTAQHDRRFVPALCFNGKEEWTFTITDRQGQLSHSMTLRGKHYVASFLRVLVSLVFGETSALGLDPNMIRDVNHQVSKIIVKGISYSVRRNIYALQSLLGRGTKVWIVARESKNYILKDAWIQASRVENENQHLEKIRNIPTLKGKVPALVAGEDMSINGSPDNTLWYRAGLGVDDDHRVHRRFLTSVIGTSITTFSSKAEFIKAMIDVVESMSGERLFAVDAD